MRIAVSTFNKTAFVAVFPLVEILEIGATGESRFSASCSRGIWRICAAKRIKPARYRDTPSSHARANVLIPLWGRNEVKRTNYGDEAMSGRVIFVDFFQRDTKKNLLANMVSFPSSRPQTVAEETGCNGTVTLDHAG
jgi:hypothetical protein